MSPSAKLNPASTLRLLQHSTVVLLLWSTAQAAEWVGTADSNLENGKNWRNNRHGTVMAALPHAGTKNATKLLVFGGGKDEQINGCDVYWTLVLGNEQKGNGRVVVTAGEVRVENGFQIGRNGGSGVLGFSINR